MSIKPTETDVFIMARLVSVFVLVLLLLAIFVTLLGDLNWCVDNYALDRVTHCMVYENGIFGRFIQP